MYSHAAIFLSSFCGSGGQPGNALEEAAECADERAEAVAGRARCAWDREGIARDGLGAGVKVARCNDATLDGDGGTSSDTGECPVYHVCVHVCISKLK